MSRSACDLFTDDLDNNICGNLNALTVVLAILDDDIDVVAIFDVDTV